MRITSFIKRFPLFLVISILPTCIFTDKYLLVELEQVDGQDPRSIEEPITLPEDENHTKESEPTLPEWESEDGKIIFEIVDLVT